MIIDSPIISGSFAASGSLNQLGNVVISGSLTITGGITGSISGSADSASYAATASYVNTLSQKLLPSTNGTYDLGSSSLYWGDAYLDYVYADSGVRIASGNAVSWGSNDYIDLVPVNTAPFFNRFQVILNGSSSLVMNTLGSTFLNRVTAPSFTGSLFGTASFADNATSASYAATASYISGSGEGVGFPFSGSAVITGSLQISNLTGSGVRYLVADESGSITAQSASAALKSTQAFTSTAGQTTFSVTNGYSTGYVDVFINGSKLATDEFTDTSGTNIVLATGSFSGDVVEVVKYTPAAGVTNNVLRQLTTLTGSAGQTVFSASYTPGLLDIFYNGSRLSTSDYTANNGTYFTLATGSADNDILDVLVYSYQVGAFNGIGGQGVTNQLAFFNTTSSITGSNSFTVSGNTLVGTASYALNADTLDGLDSTIFTLTSSFAAQTASFTAFTSSVNSFTASQNILNGTYATTGSNTFAGIQTINSNLVVTGSITAQTLVVQTITSSVDFVTGSTRFGSSLSTSTHQFTGSVSITGSLIVSGTMGTGDLSLSNQNIHPNEIDGTQGSWLIQEGKDDLFIINQSSGKKYKFNLIEIK